MAKIPRVALGDRPSGVPQGSGPTPAAVAAPIASLAKLGDVGYDIVSDQEKQEAAKHRAALEAKQAIINEVEGATRTANFDSMLRQNADLIKKEFFDNPEKAVPQFTENARTFAQFEVDSATEVNGQVGLDVARQSGARIAAVTNDLYNWASARQTQRAKGQTEEIINRTAEAAEHLSSVDELERHIVTSQQQYAGQFAAVFGDQAPAKLHEMAAQATRGFFAVAGDRNPLGVLAALDAGGPAAGFLTPSERDTLRRQTKLSLDGRDTTREIDLARSASGENKQALELLNVGALDAKLMLSLENRNKKAQQAAAIDQSFTPEQRKAHVAALQKQGEALAALEDIRRRGTKFDPADHVDGDSAEMAQQAKVFRKLKGQPGDLLLLQEQQHRVILARRERTISDSAFMSMSKDLNLALEKSVSAEQGNTSHWIFFRDSREAGNVELNRLFNGKLKNATAAQKTAAWQSYITNFAAASKDGVKVESAATRRMAKEAAAFETGVYLSEND